MFLMYSIGVASDIDGIDGGDKSGSEASCYEKFGAVIDEKLEAFFTQWGTGMCPCLVFILLLASSLITVCY